MTADKPVISCQNVWKVFGPDPKAFIKSMPEGMSYDEIRAAGYIAGVKNVSISESAGR